MSWAAVATAVFAFAADFDVVAAVFVPPTFVVVDVLVVVVVFVFVLALETTVCPAVAEQYSIVLDAVAVHVVVASA